MGSNFLLAQELNEKNIEYDHKDDFLGVDILTLPNKVDACRGTMFGNMLQQAVCINKAEPPKVFTRYENQVGKYSSSYLKSDSDYKVIAKIKKFEFSNEFYLLLVQNIKTGVYDLIERKIGEKLTESYCYLNDNTEIDKLKIDSKIKKGKILYHSLNFDDNMNYSYGLNAKACYLIDNDTIEDAIVVSESFSKRMSSNYMHEVAFNINPNDLLINLYGNDTEYKSFPDIGEETKGKLLTVLRRISYDSALFDLKDEQLRSVNYSSDRIFYAKGKLIDIDIYCNADIESLKENEYNSQIIKYLEQQNNYYKRIVELLKPIVESKKEKYTNNVSYMYRRSKDILNPNVKWRNDKTDFDHIFIVFRVLEEINLHVGSKIANRFGGKGVISKIIPDDMMPISEDGTRAEIILNALGVCNRLNSAQLYEHEINFISDNIVKDMKKMKFNDAVKFFFEYIKEVNPVQYESLKNYFNNLEKDDKKNFIKEILKNGIYIHQPPFWDNLNFEGMKKLYKKYGYKPYKVFIEGKKVENGLIIADEYMIKLKHEPSSKMSVRSTSFINMKNSPSKSLSYKKHEEPYSKTPIRLGEMEFVNLLLTKDSSIQAKFNSFYSNNEINRKYFNKVLLESPNILSLKNVESPNNDNGSRKLLDVLFKSISVKLEKE